MAKCNVEIKIKTYFGNAFDALSAAAEWWPEEKRKVFLREWYDLVDAGAEWVDIRYVKGIGFQAYPSDDLTRHLAKWGVHL